MVEPQDAIKGASEIVDVVRVAQESVAVVSDELGDAEDTGGYGRRLERHRLREDDGGLYVRRQHEEVGGGVPGPGFGRGRQQAAAVGDPGGRA